MKTDLNKFYVNMLYRIQNSSIFDLGNVVFHIPNLLQSTV